MDNDIVAAVTAIINKNSFLALRVEHLQEWEFPKGKIKQGETPREAAIREIKEETGITVISITYLGRGTKKSSDGRKFTFYFFKADYNNQPIKLSEEHSEYAWLSKEELLGMNLGGETRELLEKWVK